MSNSDKPTAPLPRISLTPDEAAASTGLSRTRIFGAIREGKLIAHGEGKATVIRVADLEDYIGSLSRKGPGARRAATG